MMHRILLWKAHLSLAKFKLLSLYILQSSQKFCMKIKFIKLLHNHVDFTLINVIVTCNAPNLQVYFWTGV